VTTSIVAKIEPNSIVYQARAGGPPRLSKDLTLVVP
jgi:hypothetical protein